MTTRTVPAGTPRPDRARDGRCEGCGDTAHYNVAVGFGADGGEIGHYRACHACNMLARRNAVRFLARCDTRAKSVIGETG